VRKVHNEIHDSDKSNTSCAARLTNGSALSGIADDQRQRSASFYHSCPEEDSSRESLKSLRASDVNDIRAAFASSCDNALGDRSAEISPAVRDLTVTLNRAANPFAYLSRSFRRDAVAVTVKNTEAAASRINASLARQRGEFRNNLHLQLRGDLISRGFRFLLPSPCTRGVIAVERRVL